MVEITPPTYDEVVFGDGSMAQIIKVRRVDKITFTTFPIK